MMNKMKSKKRQKVCNHKDVLSGDLTAPQINETGCKSSTNSTDNGCITSDKNPVTEDYLNFLSLEILCNILHCLPLRDFLRLDHLSRKLHDAVTIHLRTLKTLDFSNRDVIGWISGLSDQSFLHLCTRCNEAQYIYGFHPAVTSKRRHRGKGGLSIPGIIEALSTLHKLKGMEVSDTMILETLFSYFPNVEIMGTFRNRNGCFPVVEVNSLLIPENPLITSLHLFGIVVPRLPPMVLLKDLQLHHVHFTNTHPFTDFAVPSLKCFVMANCAGPVDFLRYVPLIAGLAAARGLKRLELIRVPFLGGLLHHVIGESLRVQRFKNLRTLKFGSCKHVIVMDAGFLAIASADNLEEMFLQPSLSKDSLFVALKMSFARFPVFNRLCLGYTEPFQESGSWTNQDLAIMGLAYVVEAPAPITDHGMKSVGECFMTLKFLEIYNCPHLCRPTSWLTPAASAWDSLRELVLRKCHALKLEDFCDLIPLLPSLEAVHLDQMFREPPKGCSRVGISTGSGFGLSSSILPGNQLGGGIGQNNIPDNQSHDSTSSDDDDGESSSGDDSIHQEHTSGQEVNNAGQQKKQQTEQEHGIANQPAQIEPNHADQCATWMSDKDRQGSSQNTDFEMPLCNSVTPCISQNTDTERLCKSPNTDPKTPCTSQNIDLHQPCISHSIDSYTLTNDIALTSVETDFCQHSSNIAQTGDVPPNNSSIKSSNISYREQESSECLKCGCDNTNPSFCDDDSLSGHQTSCCQDNKESSSIECTTPCICNLVNKHPKCTPRNVHDNDDSGNTHCSCSCKNHQNIQPHSGSNCECFKKSSNRFNSEKIQITKSAESSNSKSESTSNIESKDVVVKNVPSNSKPESSSRSINCSAEIINNRNDRVGKSLYGKKKGLVRRNDSCSKEANKMDDKFGCHRNDMNSDDVVGEQKRYGAIKNNVQQDNENVEDDLVKINMDCGSDNNIIMGGDKNNQVNIDCDNKVNMDCDSNVNKRPDESNEDLQKNLEGKEKEESTQTNTITITKIDAATGKEVVLFSGEVPMNEEITESDDNVNSCPLTRSKARMMSANTKRRQSSSPGTRKRRKTKRKFDLMIMADKWCQVDAPGLRHHKGDQEKCKCGTSGYLKVMTRSKKHPVMLSKGTSTSDPVMEEDFIQVLRLKSRSLQCITLNMVGITDIHIDQCPQLTNITGHSCRVLKNVQVGSEAVSIKKVQLTQCPKLNCSSVIQGISKLENQRSRVVILRPIDTFNTKELERTLFSSTAVDYGVCIVYDYCTDPSYTLYNRVRVQSWVDLLTGMNAELLKCYGFKEFSAEDRTENYPWGRSIYTLTGYNNNGSRWELITDIPWLRPLYESPDLDPEQKIKCFDDKKDGVYCPGAKGHESFSDCIWECLPNIVDETSAETPLFKHFLFVYVNFGDNNGFVNFDPYA